MKTEKTIQELYPIFLKRQLELLLEDYPYSRWNPEFMKKASRQQVIQAMMQTCECEQEAEPAELNKIFIEKLKSLAQEEQLPLKTNL